MADPQYQYVKLPDGSYGRFDADASDDVIRQHIQKDFPDAFKPAKPAGAVSRFLRSAADASGASAIGHAIANPRETLSNIGQTIADPTGPDSLITKAVVPAMQNTVENTQEGIANYRKEGLTPATRRAFGRAVPVVGPALATAQAQHDAGNDAGMAGTLAGTAGAAVAPEVAGEYVAPIASKLPGAVREGASRFTRSTYPKNVALTPQEAAAQEFVKAVKPDIAGVERVKGAATEVPGILDYAKRNNIPINGKLDFAKAAEGAAQEVQGHFDNNLLKPHSGKVQGVPADYNGETFGNGNKATLGQINRRVNEINAELKSNFRKKLNSQTTEAQASDADLNAEKSKLTDILHSKLADMNGLQPEDVAGVRQTAGKMRTLAEETKLSGNNDTLAAGRHEVGSAFSPIKNAMDAVSDRTFGGPEVIGNRVFKGALEGFDPKPANLPQPVLPDAATTATTPEAAQAEFLRQHTLEQESQDAAAARNAEAERLRAQNVDTQRQAAQGEVTQAATSEQMAQDQAAGRSRFANSRRQANTDAQRQAAQQEAVRATQLEQGAQDAAAQRGSLADEAREGNSAASYQGRTGRPSPVAADRIDQVLAQPAPTAGAAQPPIQLPAPAQPTIQDTQVVAPDASRGVQPVTLPTLQPAAPIEASPEPDTHHFSKSEFLKNDPNGDADAAADMAKQAGYDIQD